VNPEEKYSFKSYDPATVRRFEKEKNKILTAMPYAHVEHVGSTAVPGLGGKGVLDIAVFVSKAKLALAKSVLSAYYEFRLLASKPTRMFFRKEVTINKRKNRIHVHLMHTSDEFQNVVIFRDYLRSHPQVASEYAAVKRLAAKKANGNVEIYKATKHPFIENVLKKAKFRH
jgi:GrpB-like predicted nucleotidyltransferase (UPF0157 family)